MKTIACGILVAALACVSGCARSESDWIERTLVTVDVTGVWVGAGSGGLPCMFNLDQQGPQVKGAVRGCGPISRAMVSGWVDGAVAGDVFSFKQTNGYLTGEMTVSGDEMIGQINVLSGRGTISLRRVDSSSRPSPEKP